MLCHGYSCRYLEEHRLTVVGALGNVMGDGGDDDAREAGMGECKRSLRPNQRGRKKPDVGWGLSCCLGSE